MLDNQSLNQVELEVDGGIKADNAAMIAAAGASILVIGTGVFNANASITANMNRLKDALLK
jgi:pentose-5-phosphate-3-epimerase